MSGMGIILGGLFWGLNRAFGLTFQLEFHIAINGDS